MKDIKFARTLLFINSLVPLALLGWDAYHRRLGANPLEFVTRTTGMLTLVFLTLSLAVTPARKVTGWNWLTRLRRMLGLYAFFYGFLHFITYVWFDRFFNLRSTAQDILQRPFIAVGMLSFSLMIPLAVTSTDRMIKRLGGKRWIKLHRLAYVAGAGGVLHYWMLVKSDARLPIRFAVVLGLLLGYRLFVRFQSSPPPPTTIRATYK
ncbi:MAG TPA: protein-methionine-sulfoxide reductase heme-binding subunit MsrQ [Pyrinomonadaceae bacterium]|jgi:sulfoxide reductase heme-binding subunit YedZ|nr:protein-methionine-sulfoxide reductase heme-binding subunit MsrQ [Pyrinomonadaceae bacterium]